MKSRRLPLTFHGTVRGHALVASPHCAAERAALRDRPGRVTAAAAARLTDPAWWVRRHPAYAQRGFGMEDRRELERIAHGPPDPFARDMAREVLEGWPHDA